MTEARTFRAWPLALMALPAAVSIWGGWVGLGGMAGFGPVHLLPGIAPRFTVNTAITLPIGVEAYGAYALGAWLRPGVPAVTRRFARLSAVGALCLGMLGQVAYHLLAAFHSSRAPVPVIVAVSCVPVVALGFGAALAHLLRAGGEAASEQPSRHELAEFASPLVAALAARIAPREASLAPLAANPAATAVPRPAAHPETRPAANPGDGPADHPVAAAGDHAAGSSPVTLAGIARVRRKGAANATDDEVKAAIRELFADGKPVTAYRISKALKGSKGSIGEGRAGRLLAEVEAERKPHLIAAAE